MAGIAETPKLREQLLRERYMKGLRKRKCIVCRNTARARCPFRACKACCSGAGNACSVHASSSKLSDETSTGPESGSSDTVYNVAAASAGSSQPTQPSQLPHINERSIASGSGYLRPGYSVPSPYNVPTAPIRVIIDGTVTLDANAAVAAKNYLTAGGAQSWGVGPTIRTHQEAQRLKSLRIAVQKEAIITNLWRLQKLKEHTAGEMAAEDEAFDRYMLNSSLLEEIFALHAPSVLQWNDSNDQLIGRTVEEAADDEDLRSAVDTSMVDALRARLALDSKKRNAGRQKLKHVIERGFKNLSKADQDPAGFTSDKDTTQAGSLGVFPPEKRWESKRQRTQSEEDKILEAFDGLLRKLNDVKRPDDVQASLDLYKSKLRANLSYLMPNLHSKEDICTSTGRGSISFDKIPDVDSIMSPRITLLSYLRGAYLEAATLASQVVGNTNCPFSIAGNDGPGEVSTLSSSSLESGKTVEKLQDWFQWQGTLLRGTGWWKVWAPNEVIQQICSEKANASNSVIIEL